MSQAEKAGIITGDENGNFNRQCIVLTCRSIDDYLKHVKPQP
ncbi:hypothetical protein ACP8HI_14790 [Paenibacillus sp. FA6]